MSAISETQEPYDVSSINSVFLPYILCGMALVIFSIIAFYFATGLEPYLRKHDHMTDQKMWLLYTGWGFLSLTILFGLLLLKHAVFCVYKIFQSEKNMKKLRQNIVEKGEKWTSIHLYCGIFSFGMGLGATAFYALVNWV